MALDRSIPPAPAPARPLRFPEFHPYRLANGMELRVARRPALPETAIRLVVEAGSGALDPDRVGLAAFVARLLPEGAGGRSAPEIAGWLDRLGASFEAEAGYDVTTLSMHTLSEVQEEALAFLAAVARTPEFSRDEVERVRSQRLDELRRKEDEPAHLAMTGLLREVYEDHPYGTLSIGTSDSVAAFDERTVRGYHEETYTAGGSTLVACGDLDPERFAETVEQCFGSWSGPSPGHRPPAPTQKPRPPGVLLIDRPGSQQSELRVGAIGLHRGAADEFEVRVLNAILGGVFNSRLNMNLREDKGWTYGARTWFSMRRAAGPFIARTAVETAVTADALHEVLEETQRITGEPPGADEMELACHAAVQSLARQFETAAQLTSRVVEEVTYGLAADYWEKFGERVSAVEASGVTGAASRYLDRSRLSLVVVGDADAVADRLDRFGPVRRHAPGRTA